MIDNSRYLQQTNRRTQKAGISRQVSIVFAHIGKIDAGPPQNTIYILRGFVRRNPMLAEVGDITREKKRAKKLYMATYDINYLGRQSLQQGNALREIGTSQKSKHMRTRWHSLIPFYCLRHQTSKGERRVLYCT